MTRPLIDLGALQAELMSARETHQAAAKALTKAQEAHARSKRALDDATAALDASSRCVLANG
ncbi:hypothetical protein [Bradyrhizobium sp.]|uniref:hypothetical protein n=1 Tax=Bradyrhizobium sp. TaxID=376 RepID=UPI0039E39145